MTAGDRSGAEAPRPMPKADPEKLVLRGRPRRVVRFRRGLIAGLAGTLSAGLIGLAWVSLEPPSLPLAAKPDQAGDVLGRSAEQALADAPATYGDVPKLGPPLPGDLGQPILDDRRSLGAAAVGPDAVPADDGTRQAALAEQERQAAAERTARSAGLIVALTDTSAATSTNQARSVDRRTIGGSSGPDAGPPGASAAGLPEKLEFSRSAEGETNSDAIHGAPSRWTVSAGSVIPASLVTGLNSDLPGIVVAQVTHAVRDSATGRTILIPQGARLTGRYDSRTSFGQQRALLVWQRIIFPDGSSVRLDNMPAADAAGYAGLRDKVDSHGWRLVKGIALSTLLGVGTELSLGGSESDLVRALRESAQQNAANAGNQVTSRNLDIQPTLKVRPGWPVRLLVNKDLVLRPWRG